MTKTGRLHTLMFSLIQVVHTKASLPASIEELFQMDEYISLYLDMIYAELTYSPGKEIRLKLRVDAERPSSVSLDR